MWTLQDEVLNIVTELEPEEKVSFLNEWLEIESSRQSVDKERTYAHLGHPPTMEEFLTEMERRRRMAQQFMSENDIKFD